MPKLFQIKPVKTLALASFAASLSVIALNAQAGAAGNAADSNQGILNILNEIEILNREVRQLRGQVEEQAYTIRQLEQRQQSMYDDLDSRIGDTENVGVSGREADQEPSDIVETTPEEATITPDIQAAPDQTIVREEIAGEADRNIPTPPLPAPESRTADISTIQPVETYRSGSTLPQNPNHAADQASSEDPVTPTPAPASSSDQAEDDYTAAFSLLKEGKHDQAVDQFRAFLQNHPGSSYTDNAQYWIGESFYARRDYETALKEYRKLLKRYPDSGKASHAQLKVGYSLDELGQVDLAQGELEDLIARYPGTSAAQLAGERLSLIRSR